MGGRGSLSQQKHKVMYDKKSIKEFMNKSGVRVIGVDHISNKGLSLVVDAMKTLYVLQRKHGRLIDTVVIGEKKSSDFSFSPNYVVTKADGTKVKVGRTLIIPKGTVQTGKKQMNLEVKRANRDNFVVAKNIRQMVTHEFGHAMHQALKTHDRQAYDEFERKFARLVNTPNARVNLSKYANTKSYKGKIGSHEYVAEAVTHIIRNTKSRKGQDMIDLVHNYVGRVPSVNFSSYGKRSTSQSTTSGRPKKTIRRRRKKK